MSSTTQPSRQSPVHSTASGAAPAEQASQPEPAPPEPSQPESALAAGGQVGHQMSSQASQTQLKTPQSNPDTIPVDAIALEPFAQLSKPDLSQSVQSAPVVVNSLHAVTPTGSAARVATQTPDAKNLGAKKLNAKKLDAKKLDAKKLNAKERAAQKTGTQEPVTQKPTSIPPKAAQSEAVSTEARSPSFIPPTHTSPIQDPTQSASTQPVKPTVKLLYAPSSRPWFRSKWWGFAAAIAIVSLWVVSLHIAITQLGLPTSTPVQRADSGFLQSPQMLTLTKPDITPKVLPPQLPAPSSDPLTPQPPGYGHLLYGEASPDELMIVGSYAQSVEERFERLRDEAALALLRMIDAARRDGIWLVPISGFRDLARQEMLFQIQIEQVGSAAAAARSVAPAGYSEHHTGFAIDLADGLARAMDLSLAFGNTPAFEWLSRHAADFGFELSFPENNLQGVMYEPWHWRFVGSPAAAQTFAQARRLFPCSTVSRVETCDPLP